MSTYKELQGQIEKLQHEAENARKNESWFQVRSATRFKDS